MPPTASHQEQATRLLRRFTTTTIVLERIYEATIYGQRHSEVLGLQILNKFGGNTGVSLARNDLRQAVDEVNAMSKDSPTLQIKFQSKEVGVVKMAIREHIRRIKKIPSLARTQLLVTLAANYEGYVSDMIRMVFETNPNTLKSKKATLKDEELVEALESGDALHALIESKVRNLMYGSATEWFSFLKGDLGFKIDSTADLVELFLIRNCVLHNNGKVSKELRDTKIKRYKNLGKPINITERDIGRYISATREIASEICKEYEQKFRGSNL